MKLFWCFKFISRCSSSEKPSILLGYMCQWQVSKCKFVSLRSVYFVTGTFRSCRNHVMQCLSYCVLCGSYFHAHIEGNSGNILFFEVGKAAWINQELLEPLNQLWAILSFWEMRGFHCCRPCFWQYVREKEKEGGMSNLKEWFNWKF